MSETTDRFLRDPEVEARTSLSRAQRWRLERRREFPARIRLGARTVVWSAREIEEWMQSRPRARYVPQGALLGRDGIATTRTSRTRCEARDASWAATDLWRAVRTSGAVSQRFNRKQYGA